MPCVNSSAQSDQANLMRRSKRGRDRGECPPSVYDEAVARVDSGKRHRQAPLPPPENHAIKYSPSKLGAKASIAVDNSARREENELLDDPNNFVRIAERQYDAEFAYSQLVSQTQDTIDLRRYLGQLYYRRRIIYIL